LPVAENTSEIEAPQPIIAPAVAAKDTTILIIDDDLSISELLTEVLNGFGYATFTATDSQEGIELFEQQKDEIKLVISDVAMPKLNGPEVMQKIREIKPEMPFIFITGYQDASDEAILSDKTQMMLKPFDYVELSHRIKDILSFR